MKTPLFLMCRPRLGFPGLIILGFTTLLARGQGEISWPKNSFEPVVTIYASDSIGTESGPTPAPFTVRRAGNTNNAVLVFYRLLGTASNGTDYAILGETVNIPAGAVAARIEIAPIDDALTEGNETVVPQITPSPIVGPQPTYRIGWPSNAVVVIADNDAVVETNLAPRVAIVSPMDGAGFPAPGTIFIAAHATDFDGYVATVEFFAGTNSLG
jgi:hypothetical protein